MNLESVYLKLPGFLQQLLINVQGLRIRKRRFNKNYYSCLDKYMSSDPSSVDEGQLRVFMRESQEVPYWNKQFVKFGVNLEAKDLVSEIQKLPVLEKQFVRNNTELFFNKKYTHDSYMVHTSGSTGSPLRFPYTYEMENKQWAVWTRYRKWHGITEKTWMGWFGGKNIIKPTQKKAPYWRTNYPMRQIMFSAYHLNAETVCDYYRSLKSSQVEWLHGYPSQLTLLAGLIESTGLGPLPNLKIITIGSETLLSSQREILQRVFQVPVKQHYGLAEGVANISETITGSLQPDQDFCFTEFLLLEGVQDSYRIIGTNYNNLAFPLFRYDTGDVATLIDDSVGDKVVFEIDGRKEDYIVLSDGTRVGRLANFFDGVVSVREAQIYQKSYDEIVVRIVKAPQYNNQDENLILETAKSKLGDSVEVVFEYLDKIPRTKSGKLRFVVSELN